jgi:hypothetical protein
VTETKATGYDGLASRLIPEIELRDGLRRDEEDDRYVLDAATAPVPGLPEVRVSEDL